MSKYKDKKNIYDWIYQKVCKQWSGTWRILPSCQVSWRLLLRKMRLHSLQEDTWKWQTLSDVAVKAYLCLNSILFVFLSCEHYVPVLFRIMFSHSRSLELSLIYNNVCFFILWLICQQGIWSQSAKKIHFTHVIGTKSVNVYKSAKLRQNLCL